jgi:hypothetical protein
LEGVGSKVSPSLGTLEIRVRVSVKIDGGLGYLGDEVGAAPTSERAAGGPILLVWDALTKPDEYARRNTQDATTWSHMST